jgi:hypothetical protein
MSDQVKVQLHFPDRKKRSPDVCRAMLLLGARLSGKNRTFLDPDFLMKPLLSYEML